MKRREFFKLFGKAAGAVGLGAIANKIPAATPAVMEPAPKAVSSEGEWVCFSFYPQSIEMGLEPGDVVQVSRGLIIGMDDDGRVTECMIKPKQQLINVRIHEIEYEAGWTGYDGPIVCRVKGKVA